VAFILRPCLLLQQIYLKALDLRTTAQTSTQLEHTVVVVSLLSCLWGVHWRQGWTFYDPNSEKRSEETRSPETSPCAHPWLRFGIGKNVLARNPRESPKLVLWTILERTWQVSCEVLVRDQVLIHHTDQLLWWHSWKITINWYWTEMSVDGRPYCWRFTWSCTCHAPSQSSSEPKVSTTVTPNPDRIKRSISNTKVMSHTTLITGKTAHLIFLRSDQPDPAHPNFHMQLNNCALTNALLWPWVCTQVWKLGDEQSRLFEASSGPRQ
jgi:hypothetical protein